jgi:hypothetical protein
MKRSSQVAVVLAGSCWGVTKPSISRRTGWAVSALAILLASTGAGASGQTTHVVTAGSGCGKWNVVARPNPRGGNGSLTAVAALSRANVWAVGSNGLGRILTEHWNGKKWSIVPSPTPAGGAWAALNGIAALSADDIWAVGEVFRGESAERALTLHWNGSKWSIVPAPAPRRSLQSALYGVAALSANDVWAVGEDTDKALIERWNGTRWRIVQNRAVEGKLNAVAAISTDDVWAVGTNGAGGALAEHWNGGTWTTVPMAGPPNQPFVEMEFSGLAAESGNDIWAVGSMENDTATATEHWNGAKWELVGDVGARGDLRAVVAVSPSDVWAAGWSSDSNRNRHSLTEHWNGSAWGKVQGVHIGVGGTLRDDEVDGLAATSASDLWSVGEEEEGTPLAPGSRYLGGSQTLTERWNGISWRVFSSPNPPGESSVLQAVSASSPGDAWAVGSRLRKGKPQPLTVHWDGTRWDVVPTIVTRGVSSGFAGVVSISATDAWAVGNVIFPSGRYRPLVAHWNGRRWSRSAAAAPADNASLMSVAAVSPSDVWAVGLGQTGPLIEHWNGSKWRMTYPAGPIPDLLGVTAISRDDVWAVGDQSQTVHWGGKRWQVVPAQRRGDGSGFDGVSGTSAADIWTVGAYSCAEPCVSPKTLTERWDGGRWKVVRSPSPGGDDELYAVAAVTPKSVWAVGHSDYDPLAEHWNGTVWRVVATPKLAAFSDLDGVASSGGSVWAVGDSALGPFGPGGLRSVPVIERLEECRVPR